MALMLPHNPIPMKAGTMASTKWLTKEGLHKRKVYNNMLNYIFLFSLKGFVSLESTRFGKYLQLV